MTLARSSETLGKDDEKFGAATQAPWALPHKGCVTAPKSKHPFPVSIKTGLNSTSQDRVARPQPDRTADFCAKHAQNAVSPQDQQSAVAHIRTVRIESSYTQQSESRFMVGIAALLVRCKEKPDKYWNVSKRLLTSPPLRLLSPNNIAVKTLMAASALESDPALTAEQKQAALEAVLHSHTFARADQLKSFLRYICEMELAGRGHELTEYLIGVEALGRPSHYSPSDDSAVRNRAFALRKKLQEFYELEQPDAPVRLELNKGSYCPHFLVSSGAATPAVPSLESVVETLPILPVDSAALPTETAAPKSVKHTWLAGFAAGVLLTALAAGAIYWLSAVRQTANGRAAASAPVLAEAWGPLFTPNSEVLICVANPSSLSIHPEAISGSPVATFHDPNSHPLPTELLDWVKRRFPATTGPQHLTPTANATYWGDTLGAHTAYKTLAAVNAMPRLFPERVLSIPALRQRNVVLLGSGEYSPAIAHFMEKCPLSANFLNGIAPTGQPEKPLYQMKRDHNKRLAQVFGLITVLPSDSSVNQQHRTLIFSGVNSAGTQAAAEFFTSPETLNILKRQLAKDGHTTFPPAYQVVVRAETDDSILLNYHYETYRLVTLPSSH